LIPPVIEFLSNREKGEKEVFCPYTMGELLKTRIMKVTANKNASLM
jgi:hypothetical protein